MDKKHDKTSVDNNEQAQCGRDQPSEPASSGRCCTCDQSPSPPQNTIAQDNGSTDWKNRPKYALVPCDSLFVVDEQPAVSLEQLGHDARAKNGRQAHSPEKCELAGEGKIILLSTRPPTPQLPRLLQQSNRHRGGDCWFQSTERVTVCRESHGRAEEEQEYRPQPDLWNVFHPEYHLVGRLPR